MLTFFEPTNRRARFACIRIPRAATPIDIRVRQRGDPEWFNTAAFAIRVMMMLCIRRRRRNDEMGHHIGKYLMNRFCPRSRQPPFRKLRKRSHSICP
jgi:hypothetical protein